MCQGCVDDGALSQWLFDVIQAHERVYDDGYGPAHIVIGDSNVNDSCIEWCLDNSDDQGPWRPFLRWMLTVPIEHRGGLKARR